MVTIDNIELDNNEEWLVRNALLCYRETCAKLAERERAGAEATDVPQFAAEGERIAQQWEQTVTRVEALEERLG